MGFGVTIGRRKYARQIYSDVITLSVNPPFADKTLLGVSVNISETGMCMLAFERLNEGDVVEIQSMLPLPYNKAKVMWVDCGFRTLCKVGLKFVDERSDIFRPVRKAAALTPHAVPDHPRVGHSIMPSVGIAFFPPPLHFNPRG